jgi:hypothetical protein
MESPTKDHLDVFFNIDLEAVFKLSNYKLNLEEANHMENLKKMGEKMQKLKDKKAEKEKLTKEAKNGDFDQLNEMTSEQLVEKIAAVKEEL